MSKMDARKRVDSLHFYYDGFVDDEVEPISSIDPFALVHDRKPDLPKNRNAPERELVSEAVFIRRLEQSRTESAMHF